MENNAANPAVTFDNPRAFFDTVVQSLQTKVTELQVKYAILEKNQAFFVEMNRTALLFSTCQGCDCFFLGQVYMCFSGHNFCEGCHFKLMECPICFDVGPMANNVFLETMVNKVLQPCMYAEEGCPEYFLQLDLAQQFQHEKQCTKKLSCKFFVPFHEDLEFPCNWKGRISDFLNHCHHAHPLEVKCGNDEEIFHIRLTNEVNALYYYRTFVMSYMGNEFFIIRFLYHHQRHVLVPHAFYLGKSVDFNRFKVTYRFAGKTELKISATPFDCLQNVGIVPLIADTPHLDRNMLKMYSVNEAIDCHVTIDLN